MAPDPFVYLQFIRQHVMHLPTVTEKLCYGTPAFYAQKNIFSRMKEDGETLVVYTEEREKWMETDPETFFITDHYQNYNYMLIRLGRVEPETLKELLIAAWRKRTKKLW